MVDNFEDTLVDKKAINSEEAVIKKELREIVLRCLAKLSPERRALIYLLYYEQLKYKEVAYILDWPGGTAKSNLVRSLQMLKKCLKPYLQKGEI
ncbi:MAG TPA: RNA polymerase sigma factor [Candidatus Desulfofervidus auxilii]|uniref:RNA polymerase sigma factor n=1 Tax=Desulfofervidus auxilii TaxID=1621989 RepID=A0A7V0IAP5_DESA2|nr:RNA polymerase sigma factor [Candidatus Desulfofervidus auxilii]